MTVKKKKWRTTWMLPCGGLLLANKTSVYIQLSASLSSDKLCFLPHEIFVKSIFRIHVLQLQSSLQPCICCAEYCISAHTCRCILVLMHSSIISQGAYGDVVNSVMISCFVGLQCSSFSSFFASEHLVWSFSERQEKPEEWVTDS